MASGGILGIFERGLNRPRDFLPLDILSTFIVPLSIAPNRISGKFFLRELLSVKVGWVAIFGVKNWIRNWRRKIKRVTSRLHKNSPEKDFAILLPRKDRAFSFELVGSVVNPFDKNSARKSIFRKIISLKMTILSYSRKRMDNLTS